QRLHVRERQCASDSYRRHCSGQRERCHYGQLTRFSKIHDAFRHRDIELTRRVGVDNRVGVNALPELALLKSVSDPNHLQAVADLTVTAKETRGHLARRSELRESPLEVPVLNGYVLGFYERAQKVNDIEALGELDEVHERGERPGSSPAPQTRHIGWTRHGSK